MNRWNTFSLALQLGTIGTELQRAYKWKCVGEEKRFWEFAERALDYINLTLIDKRWILRTHELYRMKEESGLYLLGPMSDSSRVGLEKYFNAFADCANRERVLKRILP